MTYLDTGTLGAKVQSWHGANPRELLKRVIDDNPGADRPALFALFKEALQDDDEYIAAIVEYWFANNYNSIIHTPLSRPTNAATYERTVADIKEQLGKKIKESAAIALLDMVMPNGKTLADCTGGECMTLRRNIGGWLLRVARRVKTDETVGSTLTEEQLQALYAR